MELRIPTRTGTYEFSRPSIDALPELKVETSVYSAEYGHEPSQVNVTTKSGSNESHGAAFEFLRNAALDACRWLQSTGKKNPSAATSMDSS